MLHSRDYKLHDQANALSSVSKLIREGILMHVIFAFSFDHHGLGHMSFN